MSKIIMEKVSLQRREGKAPRVFTWRRQVYPITGVISWWREPGAWWQNEPIRCFIRVSTRRETKGVCDLCKVGEDWFMYRMHD